MKQYIGTKMLMAEAMTLGAYNAMKGWTMPEGEDPNREGYKVEYKDNYVSWSPKEAFEESYCETSGMNFGLAIEAVKQGKLVARAGWNGKGMFIFMRPEDSLQIDMIVNKVKSLPQSFKDHVDKVMDDNKNPGEKGLGNIKFTAYLCMKAADGSVVNGWLASQTDMLATDWTILE